MIKDDAVQRAYHQLRDLIVRGVLAPGSPLIERTVADVVRASRSTVRNALVQLAHDGYVSVARIGAHYTRFIVGPLTIDEMREWYHITGALDGLAARNAAQLDRDARLALVEEGRRLAHEHYDAGSGPSPRYERIQALDAAFHDSYVQRGAGPLLARQHSSMQPHVRRYGIFYATALITELPAEVLNEHIRIMEAIERGDADAAEGAAVTNWRNATIRFAEVMTEWGERGNWEAMGSQQA